MLFRSRMESVNFVSIQMVLDSGKLVEFGRPRELLQKENGYFRSLVDESDDREVLLGLAGL